MDELSRKFRSIDWKNLQKQAKKVQASTASALKDMVMTDLENKTRAATADTSWGASGSDMMAIAHGTYRREDYALIMSIIWQRLASTRRRCVYKSLELLKFLIMHGAARCSDEARSAVPHLRALTDYIATDEHGRDVGDGVRRRAAIVCEMLADDRVLEDERAKSRELRSKLQGGADAPGGRLGGVSSDDYRYNSNSNDSGGGGGRASAVAGTATFKGYGDDDDDGNNAGYDETPTGDFGQRVKAAAADDLLGGDNEEQTTTQVVDEDDDDENFNPRGTTTNGNDDLLSELNDLGISDSNINNFNKNNNNGKSNVPTSQLVLQLAAEQSGEQQQQTKQSDSGMQLAIVSHENETGMSNGGDFFPTTVNGTNHNSSAMTMNAKKSDDGVKRVLTNVTEKEKDPFADLVSSGKESGML